VILQHFVEVPTKGTTLEKIASNTENYTPLDIINLVDKMMNRTLMRNGTELEMEDYEYALKTFTIQSTIGTNLLKSDTKWDDIGGLVEVKRMLRETFEIPTRYSRLFENIPIKLRSGILIYGPPGSGKTLLASAVSRECGLNFITVKGPELLNKYIGESEQGVRNVFQKAESAKPCIIFFDEFDSIAAQRGKDNTGVTDRVVNQLLVQLDGVEARSGVYVLAATSRPDLIDAALLRPGRLDKMLYCTLPNEEDRLDILKKLTRDVELDTDVDLKKLAGITRNYSGADLQALLYTAQLEGSHGFSEKITIPSKSTISEDEEINMENLLESLEMSDRRNVDEKRTFKITMQHFQKAIEKSSASLSGEDITGYEVLYENFINKKKSTKKKVTLA
jgi:peroxin-1